MEFLRPEGRGLHHPSGETSSLQSGVTLVAWPRGRANPAPSPQEAEKEVRVSGRRDSGGQKEERSVPESSDGAQEGAHLGH